MHEFAKYLKGSGRYEFYLTFLHQLFFEGWGGGGFLYLAAWSECQGGVPGVMSSIPQFISFFQFLGPEKTGTSIVLSYLL